MQHFFICSKKLTSRCLFFTRFSDNKTEQAIGSQVTPREPGRSRDITMHALVLSLLDVPSVPHKRLLCLFAITSCLAFPWWSRCKNREGVLVTVRIRKGQLFYFLRIHEPYFFSNFPTIQSLFKPHKLSNSKFPNQTGLSLFGGNCDSAPQFSPKHATLLLMWAAKEHPIL